MNTKRRAGGYALRLPAFGGEIPMFIADEPKQDLAVEAFVRMPRSFDPWAANPRRRPRRLSAQVPRLEDVARRLAKDRKWVRKSSIGVAARLTKLAPNATTLAPQGTKLWPCRPKRITCWTRLGEHWTKLRTCWTRLGKHR